MRDALAAEWFKTTHRRMTYILLGALCALMVLFYVILWLRIREGPDPKELDSTLRYLALKEGMSFRNVVPYGLQLERFFVTLLSVIFAATMMGNEYDWRTVGAVLSRGVRRRDFLAAKLIIALAFAVVCVVTAFVVAMIMSAYFSNLYGLPYGDFTLGRIVGVFESLGRTVFVVVPFVLLALLFSTIWRSAGQAVGFALGFFFLEGIFTGLLDNARGLLTHIPDAMLNINAIGVMQANGSYPGAEDRGGPFAGNAGPEPWIGALILTAWMSVFVAATFWRFLKRDVGE